MEAKDAKCPSLRFPSFSRAWEYRPVSDILDRVSAPVDVDPTASYSQIGIKSHGRGIFHKASVTGKSLGNKRVFWVAENAFIVNIVFAWEQAVAKTSDAERGFIASHRFPMYQSKNRASDIDYITHFFLTQKGKHTLGLASPGGAGRNKTLGQKTFEEIKIYIPELKEQKRIADFLTTFDERIKGLAKKRELLKKYKKGAMQKLISQAIRFSKDDGSSFPDWELKKLGDISVPIKRVTAEAKPVLTISARKGFLSQQERFNEVIAGQSLQKYTHLFRDEFSYNRGNSKSYTYGCIYRLKSHDSALVPNIYKSFRLEAGIPEFYEQLFLSKFLDRQLRRLISSSARMNGLLNISSQGFFGCSVPVPHLDEQQKIADFLSVIDDKIAAVSSQLDQAKAFKKGLLQQMFV